MAKIIGAGAPTSPLANYLLRMAWGYRRRHSGPARSQRFQDQFPRLIHAKTTSKVDGHCEFGVRREIPRRYAPMRGRLHVKWVATFSGLRNWLA